MANKNNSLKQKIKNFLSRNTSYEGGAQGGKKSRLIPANINLNKEIPPSTPWNPGGLQAIAPKGFVPKKGPWTKTK